MRELTKEERQVVNNIIAEEGAEHMDEIIARVMGGTPNDEGDASNSPIVGTPVGSGKRRMELDKYLTMDPKMKKINMDIPGSVLFQPFRNKKEAEEYWTGSR
jgi:hypothetical protein